MNENAKAFAVASAGINLKVPLSANTEIRQRPVQTLSQESVELSVHYHANTKPTGGASRRVHNIPTRYIINFKTKLLTIEIGM